MNATLEQELTGGAPVTVKLGGEEYPLAFPMHAVILYKQLTGDNLFHGGWEKIAPLEDPERFIACLYAGIQTYDAEHDSWRAPLSQNRLMSLIDFGPGVNEICGAITRALTRCFPKVEASAGEPKLPAAATAGSAK
jgi:hypothetical protein